MGFTSPRNCSVIHISASRFWLTNYRKSTSSPRALRFSAAGRSMTPEA
jgi:hypothetical protein